MSTLQNVKNININGNNASGIAVHYNPNMARRKDETLVSQHALEDAIEQSKEDCEYDFNKQHEINMVYDSLTVSETEEGVFKDKTYGIEVVKEDGKFKYTKDCLKNVETEKVYMSSVVSENDDAYQVNNDNDNEYIDWEISSYRCQFYTNSEFGDGLNHMVIKFSLPYKDKTVYKIPAGFFKAKVPELGDVEMSVTKTISSGVDNGHIFISNLYKDVQHTQHINFGDLDYYHEPKYNITTEGSRYVLNDDKDVYYYRDSTTEPERKLDIPQAYVYASIEYVGDYSDFIAENLTAPFKTHKLYRHTESTNIKKQCSYSFVDNTEVNTDMKCKFFNLPTDENYYYRMTSTEYPETGNDIFDPICYRTDGTKILYEKPEVDALVAFDSTIKTRFGFKQADGSLSIVPSSYYFNYTKDSTETDKHEFYDYNGTMQDGWALNLIRNDSGYIDESVYKNGYYYIPNEDNTEIICATALMPYYVKNTWSIQNYLKYTVEYKTRTPFSIVVPDTVKELRISPDVENLMFEQSDTRTDEFDIYYPKINMTHGFVNASLSNIYFDGTCDNCGLTDVMTSVSVVCNTLHLKSYFFKNKKLEDAITGEFGDFSTATVSKIYIETNDLNTELTGTELVEKIKSLLNTTVNVILE